MTPSRAFLLGAFLPLTVLFLGAGQKPREEVRAALDRGLAAYQRGELDAAIESFETALSAEPENVRARFNLARALHQAGKGERALQELLGLEGRMQDRARYLSLLGQIYADSERFAEAEEALSEAAELRPGVARTQYWLGEVLAKMDRSLAAIERMEQASTLQPSWALPRRRIGEIWLNLGAPGRAAQSLERAKELSPDAPLIAALLGNAYAVAGRHGDAVRVLEKALETKPDMTLAHALLASSLLASGKPERAVTEYRKAVEQDPENTGFRTELAVALYSNQQSEEAVRELEQVLAKEPINGLVLYHLGNIAAELDDKDLARERLEAAVLSLESHGGNEDVRAGRGGESYPLRIAAEVKLAELLSAFGEHELAARRLEAVVRAEPDHATAHYLLGLAYRGLGNREEARRELGLFKQINDAREHDQTAILSLQRGDDQRASAELQEALRIYPADSVAHRQLARLSLKGGDSVAATRHLEQAIEARPSFHIAYTELVRLYCRDGDVERARGIVERARKEGLDVPSVCVGS